MSENKTALIIEDDLSISIVLELMLQEKQIMALHADSISSSELILSKTEPDFIFVDHFLPDGFGIDFIPELRKKCPQASIITMTAQNSAENKVRASACGSDFFLEKPFTLFEVYSLLDSKNF